jgi:hypothetical protein
VCPPVSHIWEVKSQFGYSNECMLYVGRGRKKEGEKFTLAAKKYVLLRRKENPFPNNIEE